MRALLLGLLPVLLMLAFMLQAAREETAAPPAFSPATTATAPAAYREIQLSFGRGYIGDGWQLYFNEPDASVDPERFQDGIEIALAAAISQTVHRLDIAVFELNSEAIFDAIMAASERGVAVRIVADDEHGLHDDKNDALRRLQAAGRTHRR